MSQSFPLQMNPVAIEIQQLDRVNTSVDADFKTSSGKKRYKPVVTLEGQVNQSGAPYNLFTRSQAGNTETTGGHLVFRMGDLKDKGLIDCESSDDDLQSGDLITRVAGIRTNNRVTSVRPESPLDGEFLLAFVMFEKNTEERGAP